MLFHWLRIFQKQSKICLTFLNLWNPITVLDLIICLNLDEILTLLSSLEIIWRDISSLTDCAISPRVDSAGSLLNIQTMSQTKFQIKDTHFVLKQKHRFIYAFASKSLPPGIRMSFGGHSHGSAISRSNKFDFDWPQLLGQLIWDHFRYPDDFTFKIDFDLLEYLWIVSNIFLIVLTPLLILISHHELILRFAKFISELYNLKFLSVSVPISLILN